MKRKKTYNIPHRRRREGKTNYRFRLKLLQAKKPRLVIRKSLNNLTCQIIEYSPQGDKTLITANYRKLKSLGWKAGGGSIPAAYLIGFLCGTEAKKKGIKTAVVDGGLSTSTKWSRLYAAVKGVVEAGLEVPHSKEILPPEERVAGKHISSYAEKLKQEAPEKYNTMFSAYLKSNLPPERLPQHVEQIKKKIT